MHRSRGGFGLYRLTAGLVVALGAMLTPSRTGVCNDELDFFKLVKLWALTFNFRVHFIRLSGVFLHFFVNYTLQFDDIQGEFALGCNRENEILLAKTNGAAMYSARAGIHLGGREGRAHLRLKNRFL